jgi:hypothetical protein
MSEKPRGLRNFHDDALAWLVWRWDTAPEVEAQSEAENPGFVSRVRAEWATRPQVLPRHLREGRTPRR